MKDVFTKAGCMFTEFKKFCRNSEKFVNIDINNMETIFCIAELFEATGEKKIDGFKLEELLRNIRIWLWKIYHKCPYYDPNMQNSIKKDSYFELMKIIKENDLSSRISVITTNYDIIFEVFSYESKIKCRYPLSVNKDFKPLRINTFSNLYLDHNNPEAILVCKLHGSVNYFTKGDTSPHFSQGLRYYRFLY